jgi:hypothetical protein
LHRLDRAGQLAVSNLYDIQDTDEITCFTEAEAEELLGYMLWDGSHGEDYITEKPATPESERERRTWKWDRSLPDLKDHLSGERYFGHKKGQQTMQITVEGDRHRGNIPGDEHVTWALKVGQVLARRFPEFRFAPEITKRNGSVKFFGWLPRWTAMSAAERTGEEVRATLQQELPEYDFSETEIFPSSSPQIFAPLRADKIMVIGNGVVKTVERWRNPMENGRRKRRYHEAYSCADYLNWVYFSDTPFNPEVFERHLREAVARCPDTIPADEAPKNTKKGRRKKTGGTGMGSIGRLQGRCAQALVSFWSELDVPEDDTIGKYVIVTLRILRYEGLTRQEAVEWVEDRLQALQYTEFSDRLTANFGEIQRVMAYAVDAVWGGNGYQPDPALSEVKLKASVDAWAGRGFRLHDPATWQNCGCPDVPPLKLVWTTTLLALIPGLAAVAHANHDQARAFLETVLSFVEGRSELSESMVGSLLERCGIKGRSRQKQHDIRKLLVEQGLLIKERNYFSDKTTGYRHGNFYICGLAVSFEEEARPHTPHTVSIYLSLDIGVGDGQEGRLARSGHVPEAFGLREALPGASWTTSRQVQDGGLRQIDH